MLVRAARQTYMPAGRLAGWAVGKLQRQGGDRATDGKAAAEEEEQLAIDAVGFCRSIHSAGQARSRLHSAPRRTLYRPLDGYARTVPRDRHGRRTGYCCW